MDQITTVAKGIKQRHGDFSTPRAKHESGQAIIHKEMPSMYPKIVGEMLQPVPRENILLPPTSSPQEIEAAEKYVTANELSVKTYETHKNILNKLSK